MIVDDGEASDLSWTPTSYVKGGTWKKEVIRELCLSQSKYFSLRVCLGRNSCKRCELELRTFIYSMLETR